MASKGLSRPAAAGPAVSVSFLPWGPRAPVNALSSPAIELTATRRGLWNLLNYDNALSGRINALSRRESSQRRLIPRSRRAATLAARRAVPAVKRREKRHLSEPDTHGAASRPFNGRCASDSWIVEFVRAIPNLISRIYIVPTM